MLTKLSVTRTQSMEEREPYSALWSTAFSKREQFSIHCMKLSRALILQPDKKKMKENYRPVSPMNQFLKES